jgi:hypothetical protein
VAQIVLRRVDAENFPEPTEFVRVRIDAPVLDLGEDGRVDFGAFGDDAPGETELDATELAVNHNAPRE